MISIGALAEKVNMGVPALRHFLIKSKIVPDRRFKVGRLEYRYFTPSDVTKVVSFLQDEREE